MKLFDGGWNIQHRALRENLGADLGESEIGVIKSLGVNLLCHRCVGNCFLQISRATKADRVPPRSNFVHAFQWVENVRKTLVVLRLVQRLSARDIRFEAQYSQRN